MVDIFAALHYTEERQERKEDEFIRFHQGAQAVAEYESQFTCLSKFALELIMIKQRRIRRFVQGLNVKIQKNLAVAQINVFSEAVEKGQRVESARLQVRNFQAKKRGFPGSSSGRRDKSIPPKFGRGAEGGRQPGVSRGAQSRGGQVGRGQRENFQGGSALASRGPCGHCGKPNHTKDNCWRKEGKCLRCGNADHQLATCPVLKRDGRGSQQPPRTNSGSVKREGTKPKVSARVYSLESQQVPDSSEVVKGTIPVFHRFAKVLVDPGATHPLLTPISCVVLI
ncbi:uncharacterized protein LOC113769124 [Coffea eugenioides]|uniref:uncharacterized protein LOC113769124 n=1 Tax=Coffea eugenioides TaxID=49369 RepID=UPI000F6118F7|nr:uncharacterized protein LOC113769124 [Coffea eugenioides]